MCTNGLEEEKNEKVKEFVQSILKECEQKEFTVADMKDLADILPNEISKAIMLSEETAPFCGAERKEMGQENTGSNENELRQEINKLSRKSKALEARIYFLEGNVRDIRKETSGLSEKEITERVCEEINRRTLLFNPGECAC